MWTFGAQVGVRGGDGWLVIEQQSPGRVMQEPSGEASCEALVLQVHNPRAS